MPLTRVRDLVRHAARHGYLAASFKVHGAEEVQAVVNAAEAARAPAIIAVDEQGSALLRHDITLSIAESVAAAASVPIAVEVVSRVDEGGLISARADSAAIKLAPVVVNGSPYTAAEESGGADAEDRELWFALPAAAASVAEAAVAGCRLGVAPGEEGEADLRPAALRKQLQTLCAHHRASLVADGDLTWPNGAFRSLPGLGVTKINFDKRLGQAMAKANRGAAHRTGDQYRAAVKEAFTALTDEATECLRRAGGSGRAADVMACAADEEDRQSSAEAGDCAAHRASPEAVRSAAPSGLSRRGERHDAQTSYAG